MISDDLLADHQMLTGPRERAEAINTSHIVVQASYTDRQANLLIRGAAPIIDPAFMVRPVTLGEIVLTYMSRPETCAVPPLRAVGSVAKVSR